MTLSEFLAVITDHPSAAIQVSLPDGSYVPAHFHVTEVGRVQKDFMDCGGTIRSDASCVLQVWLADDVEHRLDSAKLARILRLAAPMLQMADLPVEVEYEAGVVSQYPLTEIETSSSALVLRVGRKHTACLAEDQCGIAPVAADCCSTPGCC